MAVTPIGARPPTNSGLDSLGLNLQSLLQIVLKQLTYQDPLKPVDNFQFMSQMAQFTALEQTRQLSDKIDNLLVVQASSQAIGLLGHTVTVDGQGQSQTGAVSAVSFSTGQPMLTVKTPDGQFITDVSLSQISLVR